MLWPPGLPWSLADHIMGPQGAELELPELAEDVCTGWRVHCRGKAAHRTCGAGEPPQWVALGNPVMPQAPQQCTAQQGLICLKEKNLPRHELSLFQHLWQYLCLWEKGKPVNITTAAGILARQHTYSIKEGVFPCALFSPTSSTACYPETNFPSQKQKRSTHVKSPGIREPGKMFVRLRFGDEHMQGCTRHKSEKTSMLLTEICHICICQKCICLHQLISFSLPHETITRYKLKGHTHGCHTCKVQLVFKLFVETTEDALRKQTCLQECCV